MGRERPFPHPCAFPCSPAPAAPPSSPSSACGFTGTTAFRRLCRLRCLMVRLVTWLAWQHNLGRLPVTNQPANQPFKPINPVWSWFLSRRRHRSLEVSSCGCAMWTKQGVGNSCPTLPSLNLAFPIFRLHSAFHFSLNFKKKINFIFFISRVSSNVGSGPQFRFPQLPAA